MTDPSPQDPDTAIWQRRRERAARWRTTDLKGYPIVSLEAETDETLDASPALVEDRRKPRKDDEPT